MIVIYIMILYIICGDHDLSTYRVPICDHEEDDHHFIMRSGVPSTMMVKSF